MSDTNTRPKPKASDAYLLTGTFDLVSDGHYCGICGEDFEVGERAIDVPAAYAGPRAVESVHLHCAVQNDEVDVGIPEVMSDALEVIERALNEMALGDDAGVVLSALHQAGYRIVRTCDECSGYGWLHSERSGSAVPCVVCNGRGHTSQPAFGGPSEWLPGRTL